MTKKENFLLLSLDDTKAKKIANAVNNESGIKILNYLTDKDHATETQISEKLNLAISTVHYNLEQLQKAGLVEWEEAHFSQKGKKVKHYKLVSKYIIIAPREEKESFMQKLKTLFPAFLVSLLGSGLIYYFNNFKSASFDGMASAPMMAKTAVYQAENIAADSTAVIVSNPIYTQLWFVFLAGSLLSLFFVLALSYFRKK